MNANYYELCVNLLENRHSYDEALKINHQIYCIKFSEYMSCRRELESLMQKPRIIRFFRQRKIDELRDKLSALTSSLECAIESSEEYIKMGAKLQ